MATGLAAVGIYGVMAYTVEQRTREIGIRIALGATAWDVFQIIVRQAAGVIAAGVIFGLAGAMALKRFISSKIWEVKAIDPGTFCRCYVPPNRDRDPRLHGADASSGPR